MTQRAGVVAALVVVLLAIAANTALVLWESDQHHSTATQRFVSIERDLSQIKREGR